MGISQHIENAEVVRMNHLAHHGFWTSYRGIVKHVDMPTIKNVEEVPKHPHDSKNANLCTELHVRALYGHYCFLLPVKPCTQSSAAHPNKFTRCLGRYDFMTPNDNCRVKKGIHFKTRLLPPKGSKYLFCSVMSDIRNLSVGTRTFGNFTDFYENLYTKLWQCPSSS